jgi:hypothetical protein
VKNFFSEYGYGTIKMYVNQFAISLLGSVLSMATSSTGNGTLTLVVSIGAILFYLFLIYNMMWEIGATDKISVDVGKKTYKPLTGLFMSLFANIPNFIIAIIFTIGMLFADSNGNVAAMSKLAAVVSEGMYFGTLMTIKIGGTPLHAFWWMYFVITLPAIISATIAYLLGHRNFRFIAQYFTKKSDAMKRR